MKYRIRKLNEQELMQAGEHKYFTYLMKQFPTGILAIVADTFDLWSVLAHTLPQLKEEILKRDGKIVIRPDSGDPVDIICGKTKISWDEAIDKWGATYWEDVKYDEYIIEKENKLHNFHIRTFPDGMLWEIILEEEIENYSEQKGVIELLWDLFGGTINEQGYKVLDPHIGAIYGDSITLERAKQITERLKAKGFASTNVVLGIGSYTYQYVTRDTHGFAMKATYVEILPLVKSDDPRWMKPEGREIFKDPITDDGGKKSAKGLLCVQTNESGQIYLQDQVNWEQEETGLLKVIFKDGKFYNKTTLTEIREKLNSTINN